MLKYSLILLLALSACSVQGIEHAESQIRSSYVVDSFDEIYSHMTGSPDRKASLRNTKESSIVFNNTYYHWKPRYSWEPTPYISKIDNRTFRVSIKNTHFTFYLWKDDTDFLLQLNEMHKIEIVTHTGASAIFKLSIPGTPELEMAYLDSEYGYFSGRKDSDTGFTIRTSQENLKNFSLEHLSLILDIETQKAIPKITSRTSEKVTLSVQVLALNWTIKEYTIHVVYDKESYNHSIYTQFINKVSRVFSIRNPDIYPQRDSGKFSCGGTVLRLSKKGNQGYYHDTGYYEYVLVRVYDENHAIYKNIRTGSYVLVYLVQNGDSYDLYFRPAYTNTGYYNQEASQIGAILGDVVLGSSIAIANLSAGSLLGAIGTMGAFLAASIINGSYIQNNEVTLNQISTYGYMLKQYDLNSKEYWGKALPYDYLPSK